MYRLLSVLVLLLYGPFSGFSQIADTVIFRDSIPAVTVEAFNSHRSLLETAGAIAIIDSSLLQHNNNVSLQTALNTVPGVRMESRGQGGSPLLSIRGSMLRDPFAVRNIKIYWNDIPLTAPDGTTAIEVIDPQLITSAEIIKGPGSSLYGSGTGGVILFNSRFVQSGTQLSVTGGSYGLFRTSLLQTFTGDKYNLSVAYVHQQNDGYRQQEYNRKDFGQFTGNYHIDSKTTLSFAGYIYNGGWGLPGSLTRQQADSNAQQAVAFSKKINASLTRTAGRMGVTLDKHISKLEIKATVFTATADKENPYGTSLYYNGYKFETAETIGLRLTADYYLKRFKFTIGTEQQNEQDYLREHVDVSGKPGALKSDYTTAAIQNSIFIQAEAVLPLHIILTAGASYNSLKYIHQSNFTGDSTDHSGTLTFQPSITPRISAVKVFNNQYSIHGSISSGFSQPDILEVIDPAGKMNTSLKSEQGISYEAGARAALLNKRLVIDFTGYIFNLSNAILPSTDTLGYTLYNNSGKTKQQGVELAVNYYLLRNSGYVSNMSFFITGTLEDYHFESYETEGINYYGKLIPGIPLQTGTVGFDAQLKNSLYVQTTYQYNGRIPLNNANTAYQNGYHLLDFKAGYRFKFTKRLECELFAGVNNTLNSAFTSFLQLNDASKRYYNPEAQRNYYAGITMKFR